MKKNSVIKIIALFAICNLVLFFLYRCPFEYIFGISCPGCGMTRALLALLKLDFAKAFYYHPLFPLGILLAVFFILEFLDIYTLNKKTKNICLLIICSLFIIVYFTRLFSGSDIVSFHFSQALIYRIAKAVLHII